MLLVWLIGFPFANLGLAQIDQNRPDLCGKSAEYVPLPPATVGTVSSPVGASLTITLTDGSTKTIDLDVADSITQVCPISQNRLLVFGPIGGGDGYAIWILSNTRGAILNTIGAQDPSVSPDQHWIAYRQRYPPNAEIPAEEYMLYDLTKDAAGNQLTDPQYGNAPGRLMYPVTQNHTPMGNLEIAPEQVHSWASDRFFWSPDSRFVAFADRFQEKTSSVVVQIDKGDLKAFAHPVGPSDLCTARGLRPEIISQAALSNVQFRLTNAPLPEITAGFSLVGPQERGWETCTKLLKLDSANLKEASIEVHKPLRRTGVTHEVPRPR